ncbi:MAG: hypothetical protein U0T75_01375 [Chitinophagales bacterium]
MIDLLKRIARHRAFPFLLFAVIFAFGYLPYFMWAPLVEMPQDTYGYYYYAQLIGKHAFPLPTLIGMDLPLGMPLFLLVMKHLSYSVQTVALVQVLLFAATALFLIKQFQKYLPDYATLVAVLLGLYAIDSESLRLNTMLYTESIYMSSLFVLLAILLSAVYKPNQRSYLLLSLAVLVPAVIRSNGIFLYYLPVFFGLFAVVRLKNKTLLKGLAAGTITGLLVWASMNYVTKGVFMFGDYKRFEKIFNRSAEEARNKYAYELKNLEGYDSTETYLQRHTRMFKVYLNNFSETKPSFYYSYMQSRYEDVMIKRTQNSPHLLIINYYPLDSLAPDLRAYMFAGLLDRRDCLETITTTFNPTNKKANKWGLATHVVYRAFDLLMRNKLVIALWLMALVFSGWQLLLRQHAASFDVVLFLFALTHFLSLIVISFGHVRPQIRYAHVTEFLLLISAGLFLWRSMPAFISFKRSS